MKLLLRVAPFALFSLVVAACQEQPTQPEFAPALLFSVVTGDGQEGAPGEELSDPLVVRVTNDRGWGVPRHLVNFRVVQGDGTMWAGTSLTDWRGYTRDFWTLGTTGAQRVEVRSVDPSSGAKEVHASFVATLVTVDADGDGFSNDADCDDADPAINPGATEIADGVDNDCDGEVDEGVSLDADGDGFSVAAGDCDDLDENIFPGAEDLPDGAFVDTDCDGIDGEYDNAIFASSSGADAPTCGDRVSPCATVQFAISRAEQAGRRDVYLSGGTFDGPVRLAAGVNLFGGYPPGWSGDRTSSSEILGSQAVDTGPGGAQALTLLAVDLGLPTIVADLRLVGVDATGTLASGQGRSSHVVVVRSSLGLTLTRNTLVAGRGADGIAGEDGSDAPSPTSSMIGDDGGNALSFSTFCDDTSRGSAGLPGRNPAVGSADGGAGGAGGTMDSDCSGLIGDLDATPGLGGANAPAYSSTGSGRGGMGGAVCGVGRDGADGRNGDDGDGGAGGSGWGVLVDGGFWGGANGTMGEAGEDGAGGGGGGGSGGCDSDTDAYGAGGGGGGAGGLGSSEAGSGGAAGGGSFAIYLIASSPQIIGNILELGRGGDGGDGGGGASGQEGGSGGTGGMGDGGAERGGAGGDGGRGGYSGGGGGGAGGIVVGIHRTDGSLPQMFNNEFNGGSGGQGGSGGTAASIGSRGGAGAPGGVADSRSCSTSTAC